MSHSSHVMVRQLWRQHTRVLAVVAFYVAFVAVLMHAIPSSSRGPIPALICTYVLLAGFLSLSVNLSYGSQSAQLDLAAREPVFPARLFTLPVATSALVAWPMLFGALAVAIGWLAEALLVLRPCAGVVLDHGAPAFAADEIPLWWPALMLAAMSAWLVAIAWTPFGLNWLRVIVAVTVVPLIAALTGMAVTYRWPRVLLYGGLTALLPCAYAVARSGVSRARRGDIPDWRPLRERSTQRGESITQHATRIKPFASSRQAQWW